MPTPTPNVVHPKRFQIEGMFFQIVSFDALTDSQAGKAAMHFYRTHKFKKSDRGKQFQVITILDKDSATLL